MNLSNYINKKSIIFIIICLLLLIIFGFIFSYTPRINTYSTSIPWNKATNQIKDGILYRYNGAGFFTTNLHTGETKLIAESIKLPQISDLIWGDSGVLVSFSSSFIKTPVFDYIQQDDIPLSGGKESTWYYDFSSKKLSFITNSHMSQYLGTYNPYTKQFYFLTDTEESDSLLINNYSPDSGKYDARDLNPANLNVSKITECPDSKDGIFCYIQHIGDYSTIQAVNNKYESHAIFDQYGKILYTGNKNIYVTLNKSDIVDQLKDDDSGDYIYHSFTVHNLSSGSTKHYKKDIPSSIFNPVSLSDGSIYYLNNNGYTFVYRKLLFDSISEVKFRDNIDYTFNTSVNDSEVMAVQTHDSHTLLLSKEAIKNFKNSDEVDIKKCSYNNNFIKDSESITFIINDDSNFNSSTEKIIACINKDPSLYNPFIYRFSARSITNGKITTD